MFRTFLLRLLSTLWPRTHERRLSQEIDEHLDAIAARERTRGLSPHEARLAARRLFGPVEPAKENYRDQARFRSLENLLRDIRFALRQYRANPGFTAVAVLSLALGIGANAALFCFVDSMLLKHLPVPDPEELRLLQSESKPVTLTYTQLDELNRHAT